MLAMVVDGGAATYVLACPPAHHPDQGQSLVRRPGLSLDTTGALTGWSLDHSLPTPGRVMARSGPPALHAGVVNDRLCPLW